MGEKDEKHERDDEVESDTETGEDPLSWGPDDEITFRFDMPLHVDVHGMLADAAQSSQTSCPYCSRNHPIRCTVLQGNWT